MDSTIAVFLLRKVSVIVAISCVFASESRLLPARPQDPQTENRRRCCSYFQSIVWDGRGVGSSGDVIFLRSGNPLHDTSWEIRILG